MYLRLLVYINKNRIILLTGLSFLLIYLFVSFLKKPFESDIYTLLPENKQTRFIQTYFQLSANKNETIILLKKNITIPKATFLKTAKGLSDSLAENKWTVVKSQNLFSDIPALYQNLFHYLPYLFDKEAEEATLSKLSAQFIGNQMKDNYHKLSIPLDTFQKIKIINDPLFFLSATFQNMQKLSNEFQKNTIIEEDFFISQDQNCLFFKILHEFPDYEFKESWKKINFIHDRLSRLPDGIEGYYITPQLHSAFNEKIMKNDIQKSLLFMTAFLLFLILVLFKDWKAVFIFLIPGISMIPALYGLSIFFKPYSLIAIGFGAFILGICMDYGLHVFLSLRNQTSSFKALFNPLLMAYGTTLIVFAAFFFAESSGFIQLAFFTILCLTFCVLFSLFLLPLLLGITASSVLAFEAKGVLNNTNGSKKKYFFFIITVWLIWSFSAGFYSGNLKVEKNIQKFDSTPNEFLIGEQLLIENFKAGKTPYLITIGKNYKEAYDNHIKNLKLLKNEMPLLLLFPPVSVMKQNIKRWNQFWNKHYINFEKNFTEAIIKSKFTTKAFQPFLKRLREKAVFNKENIPEIVLHMTSPFILDGTSKVAIFTPLSEKTDLEKAKIDLNNQAFSGIVSMDTIKEVLAEASFSEMFRLGVLSASVLLFFFLLFSIKTPTLFLALLPVVTSILSVTGLLSFLGTGLNAAHIAGLIMVGGLSMDYGIFTHQLLKNPINKHFATGVFYSALTTFFGGICLITAQHPFLSSLGFCLTTGISTSFLTAFYVVPALYELRIKN